MNAKERGRRRFLKEGAALAGLAAGAIRSASGQTLASEISDVRPQDTRAYGERSRFETTVRTPPGTLSISTPLQDSMGIITPSALHFAAIHYNVPTIDPRQHRLLIHGLVDRPLIFTLEELKRLPSVSRIHFVECGGNTSPRSVVERRGAGADTIHKTHGNTGCSEWTGVPLSLLLQEAGVQKGARWLIAEGADAGKHAMSIPLEKALGDALVAYGQNGEAVRPEHGYPFRLLVPGWVGVRNVKWLRRIKVVEQPFMTKHETTSYVSLYPKLDGKTRWFQFEWGPKSVITFPSAGQRLPGRGFYEISGLAWSGGGTIRRVEVSTDGGRSWKEAQLQEPVLRIAHTRFRFPWNWDGEEAVIQSRCTDDRGEVQPTIDEMAEMWGVKTDFFQTTQNSVILWNIIYPWKVTREGSVLNALFS